MRFHIALRDKLCIIEELTELVKLPHAKRKLRMRAFKELCERNDFSLSCYNYQTVGKVKADEYAKPGKYPRLVNDLGVKASLQGAVLAKCLKNALAQNPITIEEGLAEFVQAPTGPELKRVFTNLLFPRDKCYFVYFSDDSCISIKINNEIRRYNLDISSCDASHTGELFEFLKICTSGKARRCVSSLIEQCTTPLKLRHSWHKLSTTLEPLYTRLYSGSTLTTVINNLANLLIFNSIMNSNITSEQDIIDAAQRVGYNITLAECTVPQQIQFLKHSPIINGDDVIPMINFGVVLRAFGSCHGDLPGRSTTPLHERAFDFNCSLVRCFKNTPQHRAIEVLEHKWNNHKNDKYSYSYMINEYAGTYRTGCNDDNFIKRYGITNEHFSELCAMLTTAGIGDAIDCYASRVIMATDYGL